jgi:hypothetical protein
MSFIQKWIISSGVILTGIMSISWFLLTISEIPLHPSVLLSDKYPYYTRGQRNFYGAISIFLIFSFSSGAIIAGIWTLLG